MKPARLATLSEQGVIEGPKNVLARLFNYYLITNGQQSLLWRDKLKSLPITYAKYIQQPEMMAQAVRMDLEELLAHYFTNVIVETRVGYEDPEQVRAIVYIYAEVEDHNGVKHNFGNIAHYDQTGLAKVMGINNFDQAEYYIRENSYDPTRQSI